MEQRFLGNSGFKVPALGFGAGTFGGRFGAPVTYLVFGLLDILVFGLHAKGDVSFSFTPQFAKVTSIPVSEIKRRS